MVELPHAHDRCTGRWTTWGGWLVCRGCRQVYQATGAAMRAALDEDDAGLTMQRLARAGRSLLEGEE